MKINFKKLLTLDNVLKAIGLGSALKDLATDKNKTKTEKVSEGTQIAGVVLGIEVEQAKIEALIARITHLEVELKAARADLFALVADVRSAVK